MVRIPGTLIVNHWGFDAPNGETKTFEVDPGSQEIGWAYYDPIIFNVRQGETLTLSLEYDRKHWKKYKGYYMLRADPAKASE